MSARRPRVSVYYRKRERYWTIRWRDREGRQREEGGYDSEDEAQDAADIIRERVRAGLPGAREHRTVGQVVARWYDEYVDTDAVQASTKVGYRVDMARILEHLRDTSAHTLSEADVRAWRDTVSAEYGPRAANKAHTALSSAYQRGLETHPPLVERNPCRGVKRLPEPRQGFEGPSREQVAYLEQTAPAPREFAMLMIASRCGLRQSELLGLTWGQVRGAALQVTQVADPVTREARASLKTTRSERRVPMPPRTVAALAAIRPRSPKPSTLVFPSASDRTRPVARSSWRKTYWLPWLEAAAAAAKDAEEPKAFQASFDGLLWRLLRHHAVARWASGGATITQVSRWSGDAIATIDKHYAYLFDEDESDVMLAID